MVQLFVSPIYAEVPRQWSLLSTNALSEGHPSQAGRRAGDEVKDTDFYPNHSFMSIILLSEPGFTGLVDFQDGSI